MKCFLNNYLVLVAMFCRHFRRTCPLYSCIHKKKEGYIVANLHLFSNVALYSKQFAGGTAY